EDSGGSLMLKCVRQGLPLIGELLSTAAYSPTRIPRVKQDPAARTYFGKSVPQNGVIDWTRDATQILNFVRAARFEPFRSPWGHPKATLEGGTFGIVSAKRTSEKTTSPPGTFRAT